jgi:hypothetical protein
MHKHLCKACTSEYMPAAKCAAHSPNRGCMAVEGGTAVLPVATAARKHVATARRSSTSCALRAAIILLILLQLQLRKPGIATLATSQTSAVGRIAVCYQSQCRVADRKWLEAHKGIRAPERTGCATRHTGLTNVSTSSPTYKLEKSMKLLLPGLE